jgi:hypothetical protein
VNPIAERAALRSELRRCTDLNRQAQIYRRLATLAEIEAASWTAKADRAQAQEQGD